MCRKAGMCGTPSVQYASAQKRHFAMQSLPSGKSFKAVSPFCISDDRFPHTAESTNSAKFSKLSVKSRSTSSRPSFIRNPSSVWSLLAAVEKTVKSVCVLLEYSRSPVLKFCWPMKNPNTAKLQIQTNIFEWHPSQLKRGSFQVKMSWPRNNSDHERKLGRYATCPRASVQMTHGIRPAVFYQDCEINAIEFSQFSYTCKNLNESSQPHNCFYENHRQGRWIRSVWHCSWLTYWGCLIWIGRRKRWSKDVCNNGLWISGNRIHTIRNASERCRLVFLQNNTPLWGGLGRPNFLKSSYYGWRCTDAGGIGLAWSQTCY